MDSCCFIELAIHAENVGDQAREDDVWHLTQLLKAAHDEEIEVFTSTVSIAECQHAKGTISDDIKSLFRRLLTSGRYIFLIQDTVLVAEKARNLCWVHGLHFSGVDSIHIASAMELRCDEFLTFDGLLRNNNKELEDLALPTRLPRQTQCLPGDYRQQPLIPMQTETLDVGTNKTSISTSPEIRSSPGSPGEDQARTESKETTEEQE